MNLLSLGPAVLDPADLATTLGLFGVLAAVFAESGLLIGFFLPGDSLLFTTGLLIADGVLGTPLWLAVLLIVVAAAAGDQVGYLLGRRAGPALQRRPDGRLLRRQHLDRAVAFFDRHGPRAVVLARFVPVARTLTPMLAGASGMTYRVFCLYNALGALAWGAGVTVLGHSLGQVAFVRQHIELILLAVVLVSISLPLTGVLRARWNGQRQRQSVPSPGRAPGAG